MLPTDSPHENGDNACLKYHDIAYRMASLCFRDAEEMIYSLGASRLLDTCRGMPAADVDALADVLIRLSIIPLIHPQLREIEMNPVIISGTKPVAVDAIILLD